MQVTKETLMGELLRADINTANILMAAGMQLFVDMLSSGEVTTFTSEITIDMERTSGGAWDFSDPDQVATALFGESQEINTDLGDVINV